MAVVVLGVLVRAEEHRADHAGPHWNAHPSSSDGEGCALRNQPEQRPTKENGAGNGHWARHLAVRSQLCPRMRMKAAIGSTVEAIITSA